VSSNKNNTSAGWYGLKGYVRPMLVYVAVKPHSNSFSSVVQATVLLW